MIVESLCAIVKIVQSENFSLIFCYTKASVSKSTLAVASSRTTIFAFLKIARAKQRSYFCPTENTDYLKAISYWRPPFKFSTFSFKPTSSKTSQSSSSVFNPIGSRLCFIGPANEKAVYGIIAILDLKSLNPTFLIS